MKLKIIVLLFLSLASVRLSHSQFDKPQVQLGFGISEPYNDLKGTYYTTQTLGSFYALTINPDFITNNYGGKTGMNFFGKGKINFDKYSTVRGILSLNFNTFNTFESDKSGNIGVQVINLNNKLDTVISSIDYNYTFANFGLGLGLEIAPTSFTNLLSPFFGGCMSFNFMNGNLSRTENGRDSVTLNISDFRIGLTFDAGIEAKVSRNVGIALGVKYELGNLFLKNTDGGIADAIEYGKSDGSINDEQGVFYSSIYGPVLTSVRSAVTAKTKEINWGTIYLAVNIGFDNPESKKPKTKKPKN